MPDLMQTILPSLFCKEKDSAHTSQAVKFAHEAVEAFGPHGVGIHMIQPSIHSVVSNASLITGSTFVEVSWESEGILVPCKTSDSEPSRLSSNCASVSSCSVRATSFEPNIEFGMFKSARPFGIKVKSSASPLGTGKCLSIMSCIILSVLWCCAKSSRFFLANVMGMVSVCVLLSTLCESRDGVEAKCSPSSKSSRRIRFLEKPAHLLNSVHILSDL